MGCEITINHTLPRDRHHRYRLTAASAKAIVAQGIEKDPRYVPAQGVLDNIAETHIETQNALREAARKRRLRGRTITQPTSPTTSEKHYPESFLYDYGSKIAALCRGKGCIRFMEPDNCILFNRYELSFIAEDGFCSNAFNGRQFGTMTREGFQPD